MILESGMKVLISHRRLFESDHPRFFVGTVEAYEHGLARVTGTTWTRDGYRGAFVGKTSVRTKILAIASGTVMVYQLPSSTDLSSFEIVSEGTAVVARDTHGFEMDLSEGHLHAAPRQSSASR